MKILFTGASSFTGYWFVKELLAAGFKVTAIFRGSLDSYTGLRRLRINKLMPHPDCNTIFNCSFGDEKFLKIIDSASYWDALCHHAADVSDYKSPHFDIAKAVSNNTKNIGTVLEKLIAKQCRKVIVTGSVFEHNEGLGSDHLMAFSPYGLSKGFTSEIFKYHAINRGLKLGKFVIANPFGPYEEPRFTSYLMKNWLEKKTAMVNTPHYIRDNIHICLLAKSYLQFISQLSSEPTFSKFNPSGYVETQGDFTDRFAREMRARTNLPCLFETAREHAFNEPRERFNLDVLPIETMNWDEKQAWDTLAKYYLSARST